MAVRTGMIRKQVSNQSGISLVEVMISAMIAAGISLTVAQISVNLQKGIKGAERSGDWVDLKSSIQRGLASPADCSRMLSLPTGMSSQNIAAQIPTDGSARPLNIGTQGSPQIIQAGSVFGSGLRIVQTELRNPVQEAGSSGFRWTADLYVEASTQRNEANAQAETYGAQTRSQTFKVTFYVQDTVPPTATSTTPFNSCVGSGNDTNELAEEILARVPKDTWVIGQTAPYDCYASNGAELQACINLPGSAGGPDGAFSKMLIKAGTYTNVRGLTLRNNYIFEGGEGRTILSPATSGTGLPVLINIPAGAESITFRGFTLSALNVQVPRAIFIGARSSKITVEGNTIAVPASSAGIYFDSGANSIDRISIRKNTFNLSGADSRALASINTVVLNQLVVDENNFISNASASACAMISMIGSFSQTQVTGNFFSSSSCAGVSMTGRQDSINIVNNEFRVPNGIVLTGVSSPVERAFVEGINITGNRIRATNRGIFLNSLPRSSAAHSIVSNSIYASTPPTVGTIPVTFAPVEGSVGISVIPTVNVAISENSITGFWRGVEMSYAGTLSASSALGLPQANLNANSIRMVYIGIDMPSPGVISNNTIVAHGAGILQSSFDSISSTLSGNDILIKRIAGISRDRITCANSGTHLGSVGICSMAHTVDHVFGNSVSAGSEVVNHTAYLRFEASSSAFPLSTKLAVHNRFPRIYPTPVGEMPVLVRNHSLLDGDAAMISGIIGDHGDTRGARCNSGEVVVGGGCRCREQRHFVFLSEPSRTHEQWNCLCSETSGNNEYRVPGRVTALCMRPE